MEYGRKEGREAKVSAHAKVQSRVNCLQRHILLSIKVSEVSKGVEY